MKIETTSRLILICLILASALPARAGLILPVDSTTAGFVGMTAQGPIDQAVIVTSYEEFAATFGSSTVGLANPYLAPSVAGYFINGGIRLAVVRVSAIDDATVIGVDGGAYGSRSGLQALLDVDEQSMLQLMGDVGKPEHHIIHCRENVKRMLGLDGIPLSFQTARTRTNEASE